MKCKMNLLIAFVFLVGFNDIRAQSIQEKTFEKEYSNLKRIDISHRYGPLNVHQSVDGKAKVKAVITAKGSKPDIDIFLERVSINEALAGTSLELFTKMETKKWVNTNGRIRITFKDNVKVKDITDFKITYEVFLPKMEFIKLQNRYYDINAEKLTGNVEIVLYDADLNGQEIDGNARIENKYGEITLTRVKDLDLKLYETKLNIKEALKVTLNHKYSKLAITNCSSLEGSSYDGKIECGTIAGDVTLEDKYSEITFGSIGNGTLQMYDGELSIEKANQLKLKSKYSNYELGVLTSLDIEENYEDKFEIKAIDQFTLKNSKYSSFDITLLNKKLQMLSYNDQINVDRFGDQLSELSIESKYTKSNLPINRYPGITLDAMGKYLKLNFDHAGFETIKHVDKNDDIEFKGLKGSGQLKVSLKGYDSTFNLN